MFLQFGVLLLWTFYVQGQVLDRCIFVSNFKTQYLDRPELLGELWLWAGVHSRSSTYFVLGVNRVRYFSLFLFTEQVFVWWFFFCLTRDFFTHMGTSPLPVKGCKSWPITDTISTSNLPQSQTYGATAAAKSIEIKKLEFQKQDLSRTMIIRNHFSIRDIHMKSLGLFQYK